MTVKVLVVAGLLAVVSGNAEAAPVQQRAAPTSSSDSRLEQLEQWLGALLHHSPGLIDDEIEVVGKRSDAELQTLSVDASSLVRVLRNPALAAPSGRFSVSIPSNRPGQAPRVVQYTPQQSARVKEIACAVGGFIDAAPCAWTKLDIENDAVLSSLSKAATAVRRDTNANFILRRGALVHTDVVLMGLAWPVAVNTNPERQSVRMSISDGHQAGLSEGDPHWEFARKLLDLVSAPESVKPAPGSDDMVRRWYIATTAWMQLGGHHDNAHVNHARQIFPDDPDLAMLSGAQHEAYATPAVQTAVRTAVLPTGFKLDVASERDELKDAEKLLRRATELKPDFAEAQIRLGRTLSITGHEAEAVDHLKKGLAVTDEPLLQYYGSLFLGAAEEKLGHIDSAKAAYERAATLCPTAQSPLLALSELARRAGRRDEALREMEKVYGLESGGLESDPWWTYDHTQGRYADALIEAVQKPFRLGAP